MLATVGHTFLVTKVMVLLFHGLVLRLVKLRILHDRVEISFFITAEFPDISIKSTDELVSRRNTAMPQLPCLNLNLKQ